jgi:hypothetical protein
MVPSSSRASGCTITWTGDVNGDWFGGTSGSNTNWNDDTFPNASDHVCLNTLAGPYTVTLGSSANVNHFTIESGATLTLGAGVTLRAHADSSNAGTVALGAAGSGGLRLAVADGNPATVETLTNTSTGTITFPAGGTGARDLSSDVVNQGTISVAHPSANFRQATEDVSDGRKPKLTNAATLTVASGGALDVAVGILEQTAGGTINGPGPVNLTTNQTELRIAGGQIAGSADVNLNNNNSLAFISAGSATGNIDVVQGVHPLSGNVPAGFSIDVEGNQFFSSVLRSAADFTNAGTINLTGVNAELGAEDGTGGAGDIETLTNTGAINFPAPIPGIEGPSYVGGDVNNQGTISVVSGEAFFQQRAESRPPKLNNAGDVEVTGSDLTVTSMTQTAGTTNVATGAELHADSFLLQGGALSGLGTVLGPVTNAGGLVRPGSDATAGTLAITGSYTQEAAGTLAIRVTGSGNDRLAASGAAVLGGTLSPSTVGFTPTAGQEYTALSGSSRSGQFATVTGQGYDVVYGATDVKLVAQSPPPPDPTVPSASIDNPSVVDPGGGDTSLTFIVTLSGPAGPGGATVQYSTANGTAAAPGDYEPATGTLSFGPGETTKAVTVTVHGRGAGPDRSFFVNLTNPTNASIAAGQGRGTVLNGQIELGGISPDSGGVGGKPTVALHGQGFTGNPTFKLTRSGSPDIVATDVAVTGRARTLTGTLDLTGAAKGAYDVVVTSPGTGASRTLPGAFTVEEADPASIVLQIVGPNANLGGRHWSGLLQYTNLGNVEATNALLRIDGFHHGADVEVIGAGSSFTELDAPDDHSVLVKIDRIPARSTGAVLVRFLPVGPGHDVYHLDAWVMDDSAPSEPPQSPPDPPLQITKDVRSVTDSSESGVLHLSGPFPAGDIEYTISTEPGSGNVRPTSLKRTTNGDDVQIDVTASVAVPATGPPSANVAGEPIPFAIVGAVFPRAGIRATDYPGRRIEKLYDEGLKVRTQYKAKEKLLKDWDKYNGLYDKANAGHDFELSRERINLCLLKNGSITSEQFEKLQEYAQAGEALSLINTAINQTPAAAVAGGAFTVELDVLTALGAKSWEVLLVGSTLSEFGMVWTTDDAVKPSKAHRKFEGLSAKQRLELIVKLCVKKPRLAGFGSNADYYRSLGLFALATRFSGDPNDKVGPHGYGAKHHIRPGDIPMPYTINFENMPTASAPAHDVRITDQLDASRLDLSTLSLGPVYFGDRIVSPPPGAQSWTDSIDLRPAKNAIVTINAHLNRETGLLTWEFSTTDPATGGQTDDVDAGFLPPNTNPPNGQGGVSFTVQQKAKLKHKSRISNAATIVFDTNAPIVTPTFTNTIDTSRPTSKIRSIKRKRRSCRKMTVRWSGKDKGAGVASYEIYVARGKGKFKLWRRTRRRAATYTAPGRGVYRFRAVATDGAGNVQKSSKKLIKRIKVSC